MTLRVRISPSRRWPFWLLLAGWFCANVPQVGIFTALTWLAEAGSFTHQQRLTQSVVHLLAGEQRPRPIADAVARAQERAPSRPAVPMVADATMKKIELSLTKSCELPPAPRQANRIMTVAWRCPESGRAEPPHGPPRAKRV